MKTRLGPREQPMAWCGLAMMMGAGAWPWMQTGWVECVLGTATLALLGLVAPARTGPLCVALACVLLGQLAVARQPDSRWSIKCSPTEFFPNFSQLYFVTEPL